MSLFERTERGNLSVQHLELSILFDDLFDITKNEKEVDWMYEQIQSTLELAREERIEYLEEDY